MEKKYPVDKISFSIIVVRSYLNDAHIKNWQDEEKKGATFEQKNRKLNLLTIIAFTKI